MATANEEKNSTKKEADTKQLRWTRSMDQFLIEVLIDEVKKSHKVDKTFKKTSFMRAAREVSKKFDLPCNWENVENRMKTIKRNYKELKKVEDNDSGMSWDNNLKMWKCSDEVYKEYIRAHPKAAPYLNKPIFMYDELRIVCGDDQATGSFAKSSADVFNIDEASEIILDDITESINCTQVNLKRMASPEIRKHGKKPCSMDEFSEKVDKLANAVGSVADALKSSNSEEYTARLFSEVMKSEGFDELILEAAIDHLNENDKLARSFLVKNADGRYRWLKKFQSEMDA